MHAFYLLGNVEAAGLPALRVISALAVAVYAGFGVWIFRRRHQLFDRDRWIAADEDGPAVRHIRVELVLIVWGALMLVMLATLFAIWRA